MLGRMQAVRTVQKRLASEAYDIYSDETMVSYLSLLTRPYEIQTGRV